MKFPYLIHAPNYQENSAGCVVLHKLGHLLNEKGQEAYMLSCRTNPKWNISCMPARGRKFKKLVREGAIVVYPEVVRGNPLRAKTVARYILNLPGLLGGDKKYNKDEILFAHIKHLLQPGMSEDRVLNIPSINREIFYSNGNKERTIEGLLYLGKYNDPMNGPHIPKGKLKGDFFDKYQKISRTHPDQKTLGDWLRKCKVLYTYDNFTALIFEATLCGCLVVIIPDGLREKEDLENSEYGLNGVAWGLSKEEIDRAKQTLYRVPKILDGIEEEMEVQMDNFIKITQEAAGQNINKSQPSFIDMLLKRR